MARRSRILMISMCGAVAVAALSAGPASASDWWFVNLNDAEPNARAVYVDKDSILRTDSHLARAWSLNVYIRPNAPGRATEKNYFEFDCGMKTAALLSFVTFRANGTVIDTNSIRTDSIPVPPETLLSEIMQFSCGEEVRSSIRLEGLSMPDGRVPTPENFTRMIMSKEPKSK